MLDRLESRMLLAAVPAGFVDTQVTAGLDRPTALDVAPDGRIFVAEQDGAIRLIRNGTLVADPIYDLDTDTAGERGLIGIAVAPDFATTGYLYVHYITPAIENRVSRLQVVGDAVQGGETPIVTLPTSGNSAFHNGGAIHFGPDGKLYLAVGDHNRTNTPQSLDSPFGKVLRFNPDGSIPADNPFYGQTTGINRSIYALGLRNPYTMAFNRLDGQLLINDVGQDTFEEINLGQPGANYGWPTTEGPTGDPRFVGPLHAYGRDDGCAITGGDFYDAPTQAFPAGYRGRYFFADFCAGEIRVLNPATGGVFTFARGASAPTDLRVGGDGAIYYITRTASAGALHRISASAQQTPILRSQPVGRIVAAGERVGLGISAQGQSLSYQWQRNGINIPGATSPRLFFDPAAPADSGTYRVVVSNPAGSVTSDPATLQVVAGTRPVATIYQPRLDRTATPGQTITFAAFAIDAESGHLGPKRFIWRIDQHHNDHVHPFVAPFTNATAGTFTIPAHGDAEDNVFYRIRLTVTDPSGLTHTVFRDLPLV
jgi:glucose/arabinose dehydrogenase